MNDLTYINTGMFTRFIPNTKEGEVVWNQIKYSCPIAGDMIGQIYSSQLKSTVAQLKKAGYSVSAHKNKNCDTDELFTTLTELGFQ